MIKQDHEKHLELMEIKENMEKILNENFRIINIILKEAIICPLQQSEDELSDYINIYAPKERYYIPMFLNEKWERNLDNEKYKRLEKVDKFLLNKLDSLKGENEREIFYNTGYEMSNDYYLVEKNLLREPDPPIADKILLEQKRYDKTGFFKNFLREKKKGLGFGKKLMKKDYDKESINSIQSSVSNNFDNSITSKKSSFSNVNNINNKNTNTIINNTFLNLLKNTGLTNNKQKNFGENNINNKIEDSKVNSNN